MGQQFSDAARSELTAGIAAGDTTIALADGSRFPEANAGTSAVSDANLWFKAVLQDETGFEIVYVRTHAVATTPNTLSNVMRGQEGTTARSFAATSVIGVRLTALDMASLWTKVATKAAASHTHATSDVTGLTAALAAKQATLVSGTNIKTVGGQSLLGSGNVPTGEPLPTATAISRTNGVITSMTETVGGTSRVTTITRSGGVVTQIAVAHNGTTRTETLTRTNGQVTGITVTET